MDCRSTVPSPRPRRALTWARRQGALALVVLGAVLAGCGFEPRGHMALGETPGSLYIDAPPALRHELEAVLAGSATVRTSSPETAEAVLIVASERFHRRALSVDPYRGKEREAELAYVVEFRIGRGAEHPVMDAQNITLLRDYVSDPGEVVAKEYEEDVIRAEMRREAAARILRRLDAAMRQEPAP